MCSTERAIEKLVSRIESLEGIVRNLGKVLGSDDSRPSTPLVTVYQ